MEQNKGRANAKGTLVLQFTPETIRQEGGKKNQGRTVKYVIHVLSK